MLGIREDLWGDNEGEKSRGEGAEGGKGEDCQFAEETIWKKRFFVIIMYDMAQF